MVLESKHARQGLYQVSYIPAPIYLLNNGLSSSVKNVTAFPLFPALPVRPKRNHTTKSFLFLFFYQMETLKVHIMVTEGWRDGSLDISFAAQT